MYGSLSSKALSVFCAVAIWLLAACNASGNEAGKVIQPPPENKPGGSRPSVQLPSGSQSGPSSYRTLLKQGEFLCRGTPGKGICEGNVITPSTAIAYQEVAEKARGGEPTLVPEATSGSSPDDFKLVCKAAYSESTFLESIAGELKISARYKLCKGEFKSSTMHVTTSSSRSMCFCLSAEVVCGTIVADKSGSDLHLTPEAAQLAESNLGAFYAKYGTKLVTSATRGVSFAVICTCTASSTSEFKRTAESAKVELKSALAEAEASRFLTQIREVKSASWTMTYSLYARGLGLESIAGIMDAFVTRQDTAKTLSDVEEGCRNAVRGLGLTATTAPIISFIAQPHILTEEALANAKLRELADESWRQLLSSEEDVGYVHELVAALKAAASLRGNKELDVSLTKLERDEKDSKDTIFNLSVRAATGESVDLTKLPDTTEMRRRADELFMKEPNDLAMLLAFSSKEVSGNWLGGDALATMDAVRRAYKGSQDIAILKAFREEKSISIPRDEGHPVIDLHPFAQLRELEVLKIGDYAGDTLLELASLWKLTKLVLRRPGLRTEDYNTQEVDTVLNFGISSLKGLENLANLEELDLSGCFNLRDLSGLDRLKKLKTLRLSFTAIDKLSLEEIAKCPSLESLDISFCRNITKLSDLEALRGEKEGSILQELVITQVGCKFAVPYGSGWDENNITALTRNFPTVAIDDGLAVLANLGANGARNTYDRLENLRRDRFAAEYVEDYLMGKIGIETLAQFADTGKDLSARALHGKFGRVIWDKSLLKGWRFSRNAELGPRR